MIGSITFKKLLLVMALPAFCVLSGCAAAVGAGAVVVADQVIEDQNGGDGLF